MLPMQKATLSLEIPILKALEFWLLHWLQMENQQMIYTWKVT